MRQKTLKTSCRFEGKGLHTGGFAHMTVNPAPAGSGIAFHRTDLGSDAIIKASASNVSNTARSTTISNGDASVVTIEHVMSALTGLGIDNALIEIDGPEIPILDGSAKPYAEAFTKAGIIEQDADRICTTISETVEVKDVPAVWMIYNMGVVVRTKTCVFAIDLCHRKACELIPDLDFALCTHNHNDHCTEDFMNGMVAAGKPFVSISRVIAAGSSIV